MTTEKTLSKKLIDIFLIVICSITALFLILCTLSLGTLTLVLTDRFFSNPNIGELLSNGINNIFTSYISVPSILCGLVILIVSAVLFYIINQISDKCKKLVIPAVIITALALILRILSLVIWNIPPVSDFKTNYDLSLALAQLPINQWSTYLHSTNCVYVDTWAAHMPFIIYQTFILKSGISLGVMNALYGTATCIFTAFIAKDLFGKRAFIIALLIMALNPLGIFYTPILTNQHPATMFFILAVWLLIRSKGITTAAICGFVTAISQMFRPEMYVAIIGTVMFFILNAIIHKRKIIFIHAATFIIAFAAVIIGFDLLFRSTRLISEHLYNGNLAYKICVGLNQQYFGFWNETDAQLLNNPKLTENILHERIFGQNNLLIMVGKIIVQFGCFVYLWILDPENNILFSDLMCRRGVIAYMMITTLMASYKLIFSKDSKVKTFPIFIMIFGYMITFSIIEIQPRYNYLIIPLLTILASDVSYTNLHKVINKLQANRKAHHKS